MANSFRWLIGEDSTAFGGAIRDMWNPTASTTRKVVGRAVPLRHRRRRRRAHQLRRAQPRLRAAVDGGIFNGQTITGIGLIKAAHSTSGR